MGSVKKDPSKTPESTAQKSRKRNREAAKEPQTPTPGPAKRKAKNKEDGEKVPDPKPNVVNGATGTRLSEEDRRQLAESKRALYVGFPVKAKLGWVNAVIAIAAHTVRILKFEPSNSTNQHPVWCSG
jgi:hypothetical protein